MNEREFEFSLPIRNRIKEENFYIVLEYPVNDGDNYYHIEFKSTVEGVDVSGLDIYEKCHEIAKISGYKDGDEFFEVFVKNILPYGVVQGSENYWETKFESYEEAKTHFKDFGSVCLFQIEGNFNFSK